MSFAKSDLAELKWSLAALISGIALTAFLISASNHYIEQARKDLQTAQKKLTDSREKLASAQSDKENMATYALEYNALLARKVIGSEQRLDWLEGLEKLRQQGIVPSFKYTIGPQQTYTPAPPLSAGSFTLNRSPMTLQIEMKHEEQLITLINTIRSRLNGWFMLDGCNISKPDASLAAGGLLKTECTGGWFTMKNRSTP